jgi:oligosaccharyltransferase complex subunit gamma
MHTYNLPNAMRFSSIPLLALAGIAYAQDAAHWAQLASKSKDGVIKLDSASYEAILKGGSGSGSGTGQERDYSVVVELTAMGSQFKCAPCQ